MSLWFLIAIALTLQEGLSTLAVLLRAEQLHYSLWIIHLIWLSVTVAQIALGYVLGKWIQKKFIGSKFEVWVKKYANKLERTIDKRGEKLALVLVSSIISPGVGAFLASWLDISFPNIFFYTLLGDFFWYVSSWATVVGAVQLLQGLKFGAVAIVLVLIVFWSWAQFSGKKKDTF